MKSNTRNYFFILIICLISTTLACETSGIDPGNPEIIPNVSPYLLIFTNYMGSLNGIPEGQIPPPLIVEPDPPIITPTIITFGGFSPNQSDLNSSSAPIISLYAVRPTGCEGEILRGELLGTTTLSNTDDNALNSRKWTIIDVELKKDVEHKVETLFVAATITVDEVEGPYSEIMVINPIGVTPTVTNPKEAYQESPKISISGLALPGLCLSIYHNDSFVKDIDIPYSIEKPLNLIDWTTGTKNDEFLRIFEDSSLNQFQIKVKDYPSIPIITKIYELIIPRIQWPFGTDVQENFQADSTLSCVTTWAGTNNWYIRTYSVMHKGIDLAYNGCTNKIPDKYVRAVSDGVLYYSGDTKSDPGIAVAIDHGAWASLYYHLEEIKVSLNKDDTPVNIKQGQIIGIMGTTGRSTGPHLHLEAFWWSDISKKVKLNPFTPAGAILINPNSSNLAVCKGPEGLWLIDWSTVEIIESTSTSFDLCTANKNCKCPGE